MANRRTRAPVGTCSATTIRCLPARLAEIDALTLILHGTKDGAVPAGSMQFIKQCIPRAFLIYVYDAAHAIEIDQPEKISELVVDFLTQGEAFLVNTGAGP